MQKNLNYPFIGFVIVLMIIAGMFIWSKNRFKKNIVDIPAAKTLEYNPRIDPSDFVSKIDNKYFTLKPGAKFIYEEKTDEGLERIEVEVTDQTKLVMGIKTTVVRDRVWLNDELVEDTKDWYAQDKEGNVWYFGEEVDNYEGGKIKDHKGAWEAGVDGAKPGIIMQADPKVGVSYRQEYYKGEAEDIAEIIAIAKKVSVPYGIFNDCLQTKDWSLIEQTANEYKYYCPEVGFVVLEESPAELSEKVELTKVFIP